MTQPLPSLFGQKHSSRDYTQKRSWGKNMFNSSFPASLIAYMYSRNIKPVYLKTDRNCKVRHGYIAADKLFGIDPLSDSAYYSYEAEFPFYSTLYTGPREKMDLVMMNNVSKEVLSGFEIKLTAMPDNTTAGKREEEYSCEIVVRPPTVWNIACSICSAYDTVNRRERLRRFLNRVPMINNWAEAGEVLPHFEEIRQSILDICSDLSARQKPLVIQPVWKTDGKKMRLKDDCMDVFVWSNLAVIQMCVKDAPVTEIDRFDRTLVWIFRMLLEYVAHGCFDYRRIVRLQSYSLANDKAFSIPGNRSYHFLKSEEQHHPRIRKEEIKNVILGGGQNLLSPERRFDAVLVNSPDLFEE